jgi:hypothetical protein
MREKEEEIRRRKRMKQIEGKRVKEKKLTTGSTAEERKKNGLGRKQAKGVFVEN